MSQTILLILFVATLDPPVTGSGSIDLRPSDYHVYLLLYRTRIRAGSNTTAIKGGVDNTRPTWARCLGSLIGNGSVDDIVLTAAGSRPRSPTSRSSNLAA